MGRSIYCSTCKKEKEPGRDNESRCKSCKSIANIKKRALAREKKGLQPYRTGRSLYCYKCKSLKERRSEGYCNSCKRQRDNEWRLRTGFTKKHHTGLCPCGSERASNRHDYCLKCSNERSAKYKREHPPVGVELEKYKARQVTRYMIKKGYIIEKPCEVCGEIKVDAHHDDYSKPYLVRFLCKKHHREHHKSVKMD